MWFCRLLDHVPIGALVPFVVRLSAAVAHSSSAVLKTRASALSTCPVTVTNMSGGRLPSPELVAVTEFLQMVGRLWAAVPEDGQVEQWRRVMRLTGAIWNSAVEPPMARTEPAVNCPLPGSIWVRCPVSSTEQDPSAIVLYIHGGAFIGGNAAGCTSFCTHLSKLLEGALVLVAEYPLTPETASVPEQVDSLVEVYDWLLSLPDFCRESCIICGDSAGGGLVCLLLQRLGRRQPAAAVAMSPWLDLGCTGLSVATNSERDPLIRTRLLERTCKVLRQQKGHQMQKHSIESSWCSALHGNWSGLAPIYFWVAESELLRDDSTRAAALARSAGVRVVLDVEPWSFHVMPCWHMMFPEAWDALQRISYFCRDALRLQPVIKSPL